MPDEAPKTPPRPGPRLVPTRRAPEPMERNPYAPPKAALERKPAEDAGEWRERGKVAPALHGVVWILDAWRLLWKQPWTWFGAFFLTFLCCALLSLIPVVGDALGMALWPLFGGGFALMAHRLSSGEDIRVFDMFGGFRARFVQLALLCLYPALIVGIQHGAGFDIDHIPGMATLAGTVPDSSPWLDVARPFLKLFISLFFIHLVYVLPLFMPPTMVAVGGKSALSALPAGLGALFRNWGAFLVNTIAVTLLNVGVFGVVMACILVPIIVRAPVPLPLLIIGAVLLGLLITLFFFWLLALTGYTATRDIFSDGDEED